MNELAVRTSSPEAPLLKRALSNELKWDIDRLVNPLGQVQPGWPASPSVRLEAERTLQAIGPLKLIGLLDFASWIEPFFQAAGTRAASAADKAKQIRALYDFICDMPEEVFTAENRRALAKVSAFVPTAASIHDVMGAQAEKVIAWRKALAKLAEPGPRARPPVPPETEEQRAAKAAEKAEVLEKYRLAVAAAEVIKPLSEVPIARLTGKDLTALRDTPIVRATIAARDAAKNQKGENHVQP